MKRAALALLAATMLAASAPAAMASVTISETYGPRGFSESRTVRHGHKTVTEKVTFGPNGFRDCKTIIRFPVNGLGTARIPFVWPWS